MDEKEVNKENTYNYSKYDGSYLKEVEVNSYKIEKIKLDTCEKCGLENNNSSLYCKDCGSELYIVTDEKGAKQSKFEIKDTLKVSLASIITLFIIASLYKVFIFKTGTELNELLSPVHILLGMNLGEISIFTTSAFSSATADIKLGLVIMVVLPMIIIGVFNILFIKKGNRNISSVLKNASLVGITYGCVLGAFSILSKNRVNTGDMFMYTGALVYGFKLISTVLNGFMIGFISSFTVGIFKLKDKSMNLELIKLSYKAIGIGILLTTIILGILSYYSKSYIHDLGLYSYVNRVSMPVVIIQLAVYIWAFANLIPVTIGNISLSILGLTNSNLFFDTKLILIAILCMSALIFIIIGNKLKSSYSEDGLKIVKQFSISYSLIMGIMAILSAIIVTGNGISSLTIGFEFIIAIIVSYIYSFIFTLAGYKLS